MVRVLHIADSLQGGGAEGVFRATIDVSRTFASEIEILTAEGRTTPMSYVYSWRNRLRVSAELRRFRPDVVHLQNYYHALSPSVLSALRAHKKRHPHVKVVFTAHDFHLACPNSGMQHFPAGQRTNVAIDETPVRLLRRYDHRSLYHVALKIAQFALAYRVLHLEHVIDEIISPSEFLARTLSGRRLRARIHVVRNPLAIDGGGAVAATRGAAPGGATVLQLGFVGRLVPEKGVEELIRALASFQDLTETALHVFGDGPQRSYLISLAADLDIDDRVVFYGQVSHEQTWTQVASLDAVIVPSIWYENAPQIVLEAAAVGVPVVGNRLGGVAEMCGEVHVARTCDTSDSGSLEGALKELASSTKKNSLVNPDAFTSEHYAKRLAEIYAGVN